jgi:hypothetical protein
MAFDEPDTGYLYENETNRTQVFLRIENELERKGERDKHGPRGVVTMNISILKQGK